MSDQQHDYEQGPGGDERNRAVGMMLQSFYVTDAGELPTVDIDWGKITPLRAMYQRMAWVFSPRVPTRETTIEYVDWAGPIDQKRIGMMLVALFYQLHPESASWYISNKGTMLLDHTKAPQSVTMLDARGQRRKVNLQHILRDEEPRYYTRFYDSIDHELTCIWEIVEKLLWHYDDIPTGKPSLPPEPPDEEPLGPEDTPLDY